MVPIANVISPRPMSALPIKKKYESGDKNKRARQANPKHSAMIEIEIMFE